MAVFFVPLNNFATYIPALLNFAHMSGPWKQSWFLQLHRVKVKVGLKIRAGMVNMLMYVFLIL